MATSPPEEVPASPPQEVPPGPAELIADARALERWLARGENAQDGVGSAMDRVALGEFPDGLAGAPFAIRTLPAAERRKVRQLLTAALGQPATGQPTLGQPTTGRLALLSLVLFGAEAGIWDRGQGPDGWLSVCASAVTNLAGGDLPERLAVAAASWTALAMYLMHEHRPADPRAPESAIYEEARTAAAPLLGGADARLVAGLARPFTNASGFAVDPDAVMHVTRLVTAADPLADAIGTLASTKPEWSVHKHGDRLLHVESPGRGTFLHAAEALETVPGTADAAVWATGATPAWAIAVRYAGAFFHIERDARGQLLWRHYRTGPLATPTALARNPELATRNRVNHGPLKNPFPEAVQALMATGVDLPDGVLSDCPD